ncbi:MAG: LamG domain-containing protein, partial [Anaerohalosphaeraceae bacterium]
MNRRLSFSLFLWLLLFLPVQAATVAYWRFEEGPANARTRHTTSDGIYDLAVTDLSGNGNHLSAWSAGDEYACLYRIQVHTSTVPLTGVVNHFSLQNVGTRPGLFTSSANTNPSYDLQGWTPLSWTIEASFFTTAGAGHRAIVGRDGYNVASGNTALAPLYFKINTDNRAEITFVDMDGKSYGLYSTTLIEANRWYHMAAVSDGLVLRLYLNGKLDASLDLGDGNHALSKDNNSRSWTVFRSMWNNNPADYFAGYIDEVRISDTALQPYQFLVNQGINVEPRLIRVNEAGPTFADAAVRLQSQPASDVVITFTESSTPDQITIDPMVLTFTRLNWQTPQILRITAIDDSLLETAQQHTAVGLAVSSADPIYHGLATEEITVIILENECGPW